MKPISMILLVTNRASGQTIPAGALSGNSGSYQVIHCDDPQSLLDGLKEKGDSVPLELRPCLILLDWIRPDEECIRIIRRLKDDSRVKKVPVLVVAEQSDPQMVRQCYSLNTSFYLLKPADPSALKVFLDHLGQFLSLDGIKLPQIRHRWSSFPIAAAH